MYVRRRMSQHWPAASRVAWAASLQIFSVCLAAFASICCCGKSVSAQDTPDRPKPENYDQWREALQTEAATDAETLETLPDFEVELLRSARPGEGSWISMAFDPQGRLTISREDQGLLQLIVPDLPIDPRYEVPHPPRPPDEPVVVPAKDDEPVSDPGETNYDEDEESIDAEAISEEEPFDPFFLRTVEDSLQECRGLLYAYGALYANANNSKGLYRLRDRDGDGKFEEVKLLKSTPGGVGHGRNDLALGPDGLIYSMHGNDVRLPTDFRVGKSPYRNYKVDALLPCEWNKFLFNAGATLPAAHLVRTDSEGKMWEVVAGGMRNPYGIAFNTDGEAFTYDADMEWDAGAPWYRPTRVHHLVSGADYGWRQGTGKWPAWMPESLPANVNVGLGSPTAVEFGTKSNFPTKYKSALFINEWAYGRIIAVHLTPQGASYSGELEDFVRGRPLNVTDLAFGPDGNMYFITGGRKTQSGLYRVRYVGTEEPVVRDTSEKDEDPTPSAIARAERRQLEGFHGVVDERAIPTAWKLLGDDDPWLRHAARVAIESQPDEAWAERALNEKDTDMALTALIALARVGDSKLQRRLLNRLAEFHFDDLAADQRLALARAYQLCFTRMGPPDANVATEITERIAVQFPSDDARVDRLTCELLVYLGWPGVVEKTLDLLEGDRSETEKLHYLFCLRHIKEGWTMEQRKTLFHWLRRARGFAGAQYVPRFVHYIEQDCLAHLTEEQRAEVLPILAMKVDEPAIDLTADRDVVKDWKLIDFVFSLGDVSKGRDFERGKEMFTVARCSACHKLGETGKAFGPDLTEVSKRFSRRDLLVSVLSPSKVIADKYQVVRIELDSGKTITGLVISEDDDHLHVSTDPLHPSMLTAVEKVKIESQLPSSISTMPEDLLNTLELEEILDLLAFIESGGNADSQHFQK